MNTAIVLAALIALSLALSEQEYRDSFIDFMQTYSKSYNHDEFQYRYQIYKNNLDFIKVQNAKPDATFTVALNAFADLTNKEFKELYFPSTFPVNENINYVPTDANNNLPPSWDWNAKGAVTPIKNQQQCGSCWSFSTTGSVEGCHFLSTGKLVSLSEQNLVDCSGPEGNNGCDGGLMTQAMEYIINNKGLDTEASYPYTAQDGTCQFNAANVGATLTGMVNITSGDENDLQQKVSLGPVSVAIDASHSSFQFYSSGVYNEPECSSQSLDHGVLAVGWGATSNGTAYWIVKNSWGTSWGINGFIWMARNSNNMCGIATIATLPLC